jgi:hypothetical protein
MCYCWCHATQDYESVRNCIVERPVIPFDPHEPPANDYGDPVKESVAVAIAACPRHADAVVVTTRTVVKSWWLTRTSTETTTTNRFCWMPDTDILVIKYMFDPEWVHVPNAEHRAVVDAIMARGREASKQENDAPGGV